MVWAASLLVAGVVVAAFVMGHRDFNAPFTEQEVVGTWVADRGQEITFRADGTAYIGRLERRDSKELRGPATWSVETISGETSVYGKAGVHGFSLSGVRTLADGLRLVRYIGDPDDSRNIVWWTRR